jgi:cytolysin-activating lysine-acyltransferase
MANDTTGRAGAAARGPAAGSGPASPGAGGSKTGNGQPAGAGGSGKPKVGAPLPRDAAGSIFKAHPPTGAARTVSAVLGEVVWLLTQSPRHKQAFFLADLEWMAMPPIVLQQFRMFYAKDRPIGAVLWAYVNDEVAERLVSGNARLRPQDWKCGDTAWVVDVIAPFGGTDEMLKNLKAKVFKDREVRFRAVEAGKGVARVM